MEANIKQANAVFIQRYATAQEWTLNNPIIYPGEIGIESDTGKIKVGSTVARQWNELDYNSSDGGQIIDNLDTIYNNPSALPTTGNYDGKQLVAKINGEPPMSVYRWTASLQSWINVGVVKETVAYFAKVKDGATNILCFYDHKSQSFVSTKQKDHCFITNIDYIYASVANLSDISGKQNGDTYIARDSATQLYCLYQYVASTASWLLINAINESTIYSSIQASSVYSAPANSLWRAKFDGSNLSFVQLGRDTNLEEQIGDVANALTELHNYAASLIGGMR